MSAKTITIVSGFGRCGSSLVMQMLEAGGMPVTGLWPAFETPEAQEIISGGTLTAEWLASIPSHAVKILDPQNGTIPPMDCRVIWCSRDHQEQARSQAKLMEVMMRTRLNRDHRRAFIESYKRDKPAAMMALMRAGATPILELKFEDTLRDPFAAATALAKHCGGTLDVERMAGAVVMRSPLCANGMDMEMTLLRQRRPETAL